MTEYVRGIDNIGNTCYANTAMQCLYSCDHFKRFVLNESYPDVGCIILRNMNNLFKKMGISSLPTTPLNPRVFLMDLSKKVTSIYLFEQNDIQEFVMLLIEKMNNEICKPIPNDAFFKQQQTIETSKGTDRFIAQMKLAWLRSHKHDYSKLTKMFYGQLISQVKCLECGHISHSPETFSSMSLAIDGNECLNDMISAFLKKEIITNWDCDGCKCKRDGEQTKKLWVMPQVLVVFLKRFDSNLQKLHTKIQIPERLELNDFVLFEDDCEYELKSIACHQGRYSYGHYFGICNHGSKWFIVDDELSKKVESYKNVDASLFYALFYEKI